MTVRVYATESDFADFLGDEAPEEGKKDKKIAAMLRRASTEIEGHTRTARYTVDEDGYPTDPDVADAFRDATCAQAAWWLDTDDISGAASQEGTVSIGSVTLGARGRSSGNGAPDAGEARVAPEAITILRNAGLIGTPVGHT